MTKAVVVRTWAWTFAGGLAGLALAALGGALFLPYAGTPIWAGPDIVDFTPGPWFTPIVVLIAVGLFAALLGAIGQLVAWVLALVRTFELQLWAWFAVVLALGLLGLGLVGMIAYVIGAPDTPAGHAPRPPLPRPTPTPVA